MTELFGWVAGYPDRYPNHYPDPYPDGYPYPYPDGYPGHPCTWGTGWLAVCPGQDARGAGSRAKPARDPAPLRYVGVRLTDSEPVDGPPSSAHDERNNGRQTIQPALRAGRAFARISENQLAASPPFPHFTVRLSTLAGCRGDRPDDALAHRVAWCPLSTSGEGRPKAPLTLGGLAMGWGQRRNRRRCRYSRRSCRRHPGSPG